MIRLPRVQAIVFERYRVCVNPGVRGGIPVIKDFALIVNGFAGDEITRGFADLRRVPPDCNGVWGRVPTHVSGRS